MPRQQSVPHELIKQVFDDLLEERGVAPKPAEVAAVLTERLDREVRPTLVRSVFHKNREAWNLPKAGAGRLAAMQYRAAERLGNPLLEHTEEWYWRALAAKERADAGLLDPENKLAREGLRLAEDLTHFGDVVDYDPNAEKPFFVRPAWPWELGDYLKAPEPEDVQTVLREALSTPEGEVVGVDGKTYTIAPDHRSAWTERLLEATEELG